MPPPKAAGPNAFCSTIRIRVALKRKAETKTVSNRVTKTNRFIDWILFEHASHVYRDSFSLLDSWSEPLVKDQNWRSNPAYLTSDIATTTSKYRTKSLDAQGGW
jgi:hypothetical protein